MEKTILEGQKFDQRKTRWDLLPWGEVQEIVKVLTYGVEKYPPDNWKKVFMPRTRYFSALMRHLVAWWGGERNDLESGHSHLAHAGCCLLFLLWFDRPDVALGAKDLVSGPCQDRSAKTS